MSSSNRKPRFRPSLTAAALLVGVFGFTSIAAHANPVTIQDGHVQAGVSDYGTLGSDYATSPGILYDPTGTGNYGVNDLLTPGTPFEGFYITASGGLSWCNNNDESCSSFNSTAPTLLSATSATWTATTTDGSLTVSNLYSLATIAGKSMITITTTLTNNTAGLLSGLEFLRTLDPDPDYYNYGFTNTNNTILSNSQVCAAGPVTNLTVCLASFSSFLHDAGISNAWSTLPADYLAGVNDGNGDNTIGIGFDLGDLAAGDTITLQYGYGVGASLADASFGSVPEPSNLAMFGLGALGLLGLLGVDATRRKRRLSRSA